MWLTPPAYLEFGNEADNIKQYEKEKFNSIGTNPKIRFERRLLRGATESKTPEWAFLVTSHFLLFPFFFVVSDE